jgi:hypothetical protein
MLNAKNSSGAGKKTRRAKVLLAKSAVNTDNHAKAKSEEKTAVGEDIFDRDDLCPPRPLPSNNLLRDFLYPGVF